MEMVLSFLIDRKGVVENPVADAMQGKHFMKVLMISKMVKMLLTIILIAVYIILVKDHVVEFVISAVAFYLLNLCVETYVVTKRVKSEK
jgi:O-antigen/teichoic acid export membrane protein